MTPIILIIEGGLRVSVGNSEGDVKFLYAMIYLSPKDLGTNTLHLA